MTPHTQQFLLDLNRSFYATVADSFDGTRANIPPGMVQALGYLPKSAASGSLRILDAGCGNGRFAWALDQLGSPVEYTGVDADTRLLELARVHAIGLYNVRVHFVQADLAEVGWASRLNEPGDFDTVVCLATLHHFPGYALRQRIVAELATLLAAHGRLIVATWQFLSAPRLLARQLNWEMVGLTPADVESGDALLPWQQTSGAVRYVHQIDGDEMQALAGDCGLHIAAQFSADGKEGNLNLFTILER
jgi:SAM-dependent methyltransferase